MNTNFRTALIASVSVLIGAGAVMAAVSLPGDDAPAPRSVKIQEAADVDDTTSTTVAEVKPAPTEPTLAPGFEDFKPGDALPTPAALPAAGEAVETVPGPYGPIYPDGYFETVTTIAPPLEPCMGAGGAVPRNSDGTCP